MIKTNKITVELNFKEILKKTKSLKSDTIYPYQVFGTPSDKLRVYISRLADRGVIVKVGRGRFYKPKNMVAIKRFLMVGQSIMQYNV